MEEALKSMNDSLDEFMLNTVALSLGVPIWIFSEIALNLRRLDIAEEECLNLQFLY